MKKWFKKLLKAIEDANKNNFDSGKMDCCDLNKNKKAKRKTNTGGI
ncbi:LDCC motif putative metal-binding protein [Alkaliphilus transvaalensis]|nr:LDCC motif putative metal-binding protein [Alkaliphilus transvaalensis]